MVELTFVILDHLDSKIYAILYQLIYSIQLLKNLHHQIIKFVNRSENFLHMDIKNNSLALNALIIIDAENYLKNLKV